MPGRALQRVHLGSQHKHSCPWPSIRVVRRPSRHHFFWAVLWTCRLAGSLRSGYNKIFMRKHFVSLRHMDFQRFPLRLEPANSFLSSLTHRLPLQPLSRLPLRCLARPSALLSFCIAFLSPRLFCVGFLFCWLFFTPRFHCLDKQGEV